MRKPFHYFNRARKTGDALRGEFENLTKCTQKERTTRFISEMSFLFLLVKFLLLQK